MTLTIRLTASNGCTREVLYSVPPGSGHTIFESLTRQAFAVCYPEIEGDDTLSREASHYTPPADS